MLFLAPPPRALDSVLIPFLPCQLELVMIQEGIKVDDDQHVSGSKVEESDVARATRRKEQQQK